MPRKLKYFCCLLTIFVYLAPLSALEIGQTAPDWTLNGQSGDSINYSEDTQGNISIVLFWATWCPYCRALMPHLQSLADEFRDEPVKFYALNIWEDGDPVKYMQEQGFTFTLLLNADPVTKDYDVKGTPGLFVIDQNRQISYIRKSGQDAGQVEEAVRRMVNELQYIDTDS